jgi:hypothetical protein
MLGLAPVRGSFAIRAGTIGVTEPLTASRISAVIEAASFQTGNAQRDTSVRSSRFLDSDQYPVMAFSGKGLDGQVLAGTLTVRDVTRPVSLRVELLEVAAGWFTVRATTRIDRTEFGVTALRGLAGRPELLFLGEPTTGFDPGARREAWDIIRGLREEGTTIVLTTHYMDEAQTLADRLAVMSAGQVVAEGTPAAIGGRDRARARIRFALPDGCTVADLPLDAVPGDGLVTVETAEPTGALHLLTGWALHRGTALARLTVDQPSLEDVYLRLTGGGRATAGNERSR